ncbi:glycosyltransferase [Staphylotrichum tortipilum]|uniref:Dol-P-Glc:Glc(2)Man(9)GlcNAc(2)-PP-Dol alpha-1,2-glucosyltransferase n=1 Tax=Staphylotrichum tortipilum TaxID=2831512 RepID=A0AAN6MPL1_9PEZI|nr:glycosyltransferase [Staphylotrichum longicolle]
MEVIQTLCETLTVAELGKGLGTAFLLSRFLVSSTGKGPTSGGFWSISSPRNEAIKTACFFALFLAARSWLALVDRYVPEPYLDEAFHIPQAQTYCEGRFWDWDDKITTPPGLYLLSVAYHKLWMIAECTPSSLRSNNLFATLLTALLAAQCRQLIEVRGAEREGKTAAQGISAYAFHSGINIALFPVIFFFSGLYYTDVVSTLVVLVAYRNHLQRVGQNAPGLGNDLWTVLLGVVALFMRQTNVFWVVVYMGGLEAVHVARSVKPAGEGLLAKVHDPTLNQSGPEDWLFCALTVAFAALTNPLKILRQIWPHLTTLALFAGFVAWNGGVVLGDKSNHIATLHLAQLLYLWPLILFFSLPLPALSFLRNPAAFLKSLFPLPTRHAALVTIPFVVITVVLSVGVVRYSTIIHPFTLADNRHYMFYVFRYTILRSGGVRMGLVGVYTMARWVVWGELAGSPATAATTTTGKGEGKGQVKGEEASGQPPVTSTALLWVLATALSLVTAPLVEPRYFILPWVFYRLLVPSRGRPGGIDGRVVLETVWFMVANAVTMGVFLGKPFYWRGEDGQVLDGGRVQRFMW